MTRSKKTLINSIGQFTTPCLLVFLLALFYPVFLGKHPVQLFSLTGFIFFLLTVICPLYIIAQMKISYKTIIIDTTLKTISFKLFLLPVTKTYHLNYFDGYVATLVKDYYGDYKCLYLVKDGKLLYKMSGRFYRNIDEIQTGLSSLQYLGYIEYSFGLSLKVALGEEIVTP